eukprot:TRINITY_DN4973_c0_g1_i4.p1 TRINITY_DN4973_c0_g1~~TRINITY_DN4973_c0_g1_i4.p1  ORF type:complete len:391 (-),score=28.61 TRINITY_DN4973_c0_g1_i4:61-1233(-)
MKSLNIPIQWRWEFCDTQHNYFFSFFNKYQIQIFAMERKSFAKKIGKHLEDWNTREVIDFLQELPQGFRSNLKLFERENVTGSTLAKLRADDLKEIYGITVPQLRATLLDAIQFELSSYPTGDIPKIDSDSPLSDRKAPARRPEPPPSEAPPSRVALPDIPLPTNPTKGTFEKDLCDLLGPIPFIPPRNLTPKEEVKEGVKEEKEEEEVKEEEEENTLPNPGKTKKSISVICRSIQDGQSENFTFPIEERITVGREAKSTNVKLPLRKDPDSTISRTHLEIWYDKDVAKLKFRDCKSLWGTFVIGPKDSEYNVGEEFDVNGILCKFESATGSEAVVQVYIAKETFPLVIREGEETYPPLEACLYLNTGESKLVVATETPSGVWKLSLIHI